MRRAALLLALVACDEPARLTAPGVLEGAVLHARGYEAAPYTHLTLPTSDLG